MAQLGSGASDATLEAVTTCIEMASYIQSTAVTPSGQGLCSNKFQVNRASIFIFKLFPQIV